MSRRETHWSIDEIKTLSTEEILQKLYGFGISITEEKFLEEIKGFHSACDLADKWVLTYPVTARGLDEDFIWMAALVLWERLAPQIINSERLDDMMQKGYDLLKENRVTEACDLWLEVWEHLKKFLLPETKAIENAEGILFGTQSLYNWSQDLEMELGNAGLDDRSYFEKRIQYTQEFCTLFPESDRLIMESMKRAEAESYFGLGLIEEGEEAFRRLVEKYPHSAWAYIGWADQYWLFPFNEQSFPDYKKAEEIYRLALQQDLDDRQAVLDRLNELAERKKLPKERD